jgi:hypothetical protein
MGVGPDREVPELGALLAGGLGQLGAAMSGLHGEQSREGVEVALAVDIPDVATLPSLHDGDDLVAGCEAGEMTPEIGLGHGSQICG